MEQGQRCRLSWADAPPEVLGLVLGRLPTLADRYRFGAVCWPWYTAERHLPRRWQLPWLALSLPSPPTANRASFYSLSDEAVYHLSLPAGAGGVCAALAGSADDWLVVAHRDRGNFLVNPFTGAMLPLPHQHTITRIAFRQADNQVAEYYPPRSQREPFIRKAVLSCATSEDDPGRCIVAAVADSGELFFCRPGQGSWRRPMMAKLEGIHSTFEDITFCNGKLYGTLWYRWLTSLQTMRVFDLDEDTDQLVESGDDEGRLLMVGRYCWNYMDGTVGRTCSFKVYHRVPVQPEVLFVGSSGARSFAAAEHGVDADCICFADDHCQEQGDTVPVISCLGPDDPAKTRPCRDIGKYCMRDGSVMYLKDLPSNERRSPPVWLYLSEQRR
ncbi:unnamed protein product [Urochloa decumbens]|uniref:KIB1-4 beta-propeller domain-containing protein n=1 Tax=Urochloa decumbens TaxID=240449 RepID=A0ABC9AC42_9POAL